ncbi:pitrilysin family protein [soil metagenome]
MSSQPEILERSLSNGLTVLLRESHDAPVASFWVFYRVGSRNELPGQTGISHWVEHMQFKGTPSLPKGSIFGEVTRNGGSLNAFTSYDWTTYFETLPVDRLDLSLRIESDRMVNSIFDPTETESERTVILSERQGGENRPGYFLNEEMMGTAFHHHPYGHSIIGYESDLKRITRDELFSHYKNYYTPANAVVVASGDFDAEELFGRIEASFGGIEGGPAPVYIAATEPQQRAERRLILRRPAPTAVVRMAYRAPEAAHPDTAALMIADAILSGAKPMGLGGGGNMGRSARLYKALVSTSIARSAGSDFDLMIDPFLLSLSASALPGGDVEKIEAVMNAEVERLGAETPSDAEVSRAIKQVKAQYVYSGEGVTSQAFWLGSMAVVDRWQRALTLVDELEAVTPDDVQRVAKTYLRPDQRTTGLLIPSSGSSGGSADVEGPAAFRRFFFTGAPVLPAGAAHSGEANDYRFERVTLANGILILGQAQPDDPAISVRMRIAAGGALDPKGREGLAYLTGRNLLRGSAGKTFAEINDITDGIGASIGASPGRTATDLSIKSLAEDLPQLLDLAAAALISPDFPAEELEKIRQETLGAIKEQADSTGAAAERAMRELLLPEGHPSRHSLIGEPETVNAITREDLAAFHHDHFGPAVLTISVVGGIESIDAFAALIQERFGDWNGAATRPAELPPIPKPEAASRANRGIEGKSQSDIAIGFPTLKRSDPDYFPLELGNLILGRLGLMGRLGASVRDLQGLAYYAGSSVDAGRSFGMWSARAGVDPKNVEQAIKSIGEELAKLRTELVTEQELSDAKSYLTGSVPLALERNDGIADLLLSIEHHELGLDYLERYPMLINAVTAEQILAAAQTHLDETKLAVGVAGPTEG